MKSSRAETNLSENEQPSISEQELEIDQLKKIILYKDAQLDVIKYQSATSISQESIKVSKPIFLILIFSIIGLGLTVAYSFIYNENGQYYSANSKEIENYTNYKTPLDTGILTPEKINKILNDGINLASASIPKNHIKKPDIITEKPIDPIKKPKKQVRIGVSPDHKKEKKVKEISQPRIDKLLEYKYITPEVFNDDTTYFRTIKRYNKYTIVVSKANLYDQPDVRKRGSYFMVASKGTELSAIEEKNDFIFVEFLNPKDQVSKGWLRKADLRLLYYGNID